MNKTRAAFAFIMMLLLICSTPLACLAEQAEPKTERIGIDKLIEPNDMPATAQLELHNEFASGATPRTKEIACEITVNGITYGCEFEFDVVGSGLKDWSPVREWLGEIVTSAARTNGDSAKALAEEVKESMQAKRQAAAPDSKGEYPVWANKNIAVRTIRVSSPFFPQLAMNYKGERVRLLQERLIELGFLTGGADGIFGEQTKSAVKELESYVRELEQDWINEQASESYAPGTSVDGIADSLLQAYAFSSSFPSARQQLTLGDSNTDVKRMQRRLIALGYARGSADSIYGEQLERSVRVFQHYNDLEETGIADIKTQEKIFSKDVYVPEYSMLTNKARGEDVKKLQTRLFLLGFGMQEPDGDYGPATVSMVETFQSYLREIERAELVSKDESLAPDVNLDDKLTTPLDGIADPILQEKLFSGEFPVIPEDMSAGSRGEEVKRLQRRLQTLFYLNTEIDGRFGAQTTSAVKSFQRRNGLGVTGTADQKTMELLFSDKAIEEPEPYKLVVSTKKQRVYAYGLDENDDYTVEVRTMKCSTGKDNTPTPRGTYQSTTAPGKRWHYFKKFEIWAQYAYYIKGDIMFHSILFPEKGGSPTSASKNALGKKASHGCVRLSVEDAKWIYENCPAGTTVVVE